LTQDIKEIIKGKPNKPKGNLAEFAINCQFGCTGADLLRSKPALTKLNPVLDPQGFPEFSIKLLAVEGYLY
jgi:hypothetical protein